MPSLMENIFSGSLLSPRITSYNVCYTKLLRAYSIGMRVRILVAQISADLKELWENAPDCSLDVVTCNPPYKINNTGAKNDLEAVTIARHEVLCSIDVITSYSIHYTKLYEKLPGGTMAWASGNAARTVAWSPH